MNVQQSRMDVVAEARSWISTPYRHMASVKGVGVDCAMIIVEIYSSLGLFEWFEPRPYSTDWHFHRNEERYLEELGKRMHVVGEYIPEHIKGWYDPMEVPNTSPGNVVVWRVGRTFSHGAVITDWPYVVHASAPSKCVLEERIEKTWLARRAVKVYSIWDD